MSTQPDNTIIKAQQELERLLQLMVRLRDPNTGCPWDQQQTFASIVPHTIEEAYEVADAIARGDRADIKSELGDLLFQVVFYAQIAAEEGIFDFATIAATITDKMIRRHPHVFADVKYADTAEQNAAWEAIKRTELQQQSTVGENDTEQASVLDGVTVGLPALTRAVKLQRRASQVGFDWSQALPIIAKIKEELEELEEVIEQEPEAHERLQEELGDLLFACANLGRHLKLDPEAALRAGNAKFERRFRAIEVRVSELGKQMEALGLAELDALWDEVKREEKS